MINNILSKIQGVNGQNIRPLQPKFPLNWSDNFGPWSPIMDTESSIKQNFLFLLLTEPGEWPMSPDLGVGLKRYLFESYQSEQLQEIRSRIQNQISKYLPRVVRLLDAKFVTTPEAMEEGIIKLRILYSILGTTTVVSRIEMSQKGYLNITDEIFNKNSPNVRDLLPLTSSESEI